MEESPEGATALEGDLLMEEDGEWRPTEGLAEGHKSHPRAAANKQGPEEAGASRREGDSDPHRGRGHRPGAPRQETSPP